MTSDTFEPPPEHRLTGSAAAYEPSSKPASRLRNRGRNSLRRSMGERTYWRNQRRRKIT